LGPKGKLLLAREKKKLDHPGLFNDVMRITETKKRKASRNDMCGEYV